MRSIKNIFTSVILVSLTALCMIFLLQNGDLVRVNLLHFSTPQKPLWMFVLGALLAGMLIASLFALIHSIKLRASIRTYKKRQKTLEQELHALRNQPLDEIPEDAPVEVATLVESEGETQDISS